MTFNEFVKKYLGKATDIDNVSGVQCVDLAKMYIKDVIGAKPLAIGNAHAYYDDFNNTYLKKYFKRIPYKNGNKPQRGDLVVWGKYYNGRSQYGHIAIATGRATDSVLYTYDQNWGGKEMKEVKHTYTGLLGYLRPLDQTNIKEVEKLPSFKIGHNYKLLDNMNVRTGAGTKYARKKRKELTPDGKKHAKNTIYAVLKAGTTVTLAEVKTADKEVWGKIPSGWICLYKDGKQYVK